MKINIWVNKEKVEDLNKLIKEGKELPHDFEYFIREPGQINGIYVLSVQLTYEEFVLLNDH
tara:strand:+ start:445 stop:627 length:183 start_codon:yes stop_codon:yes gene_type:complete